MRKPRKHIYSVNESFFDIIDEELKAYWLGFLWADGWSTEDQLGRKYVGLTLARFDTRHLEKFRAAIGATYPIHYGVNNGGYDYCIMRIRSDYLFDALYRIGLVPNKTLKLKFPTVVPDKFLSHFIRGLMDGDGCYYVSEINDPSFSLHGTLDVVSSVQSIYVSQCGVNRTKIYHPSKSYTIHYCGRLNVCKVRDYLYHDFTVCLDNKYELIREL